MFFQNNVYQQLKIKVCRNGYQKHEGKVEWVAGLFFLLFLAILLCTQLQLDAYRASSAYLEDALAASNLASAVIDLKEYGKSHEIMVENPRNAYEMFCLAVKGNLQLNDNWECENKSLISGKVLVEDYTVYNVKKDTVTVYEFFADGQMVQWEGTLGSVQAPNGMMIESTSIYSELIFPVEGFLGVTVEAHKGKLVDIVANGEEVL